MYKLTKEILDLLKKQYIAVAGQKPFQNTTEAREYYLENLDDNLYKPMSPEIFREYENGSGNEISSGKMNSLRSSSALTYNLFWSGTASVSKNFFSGSLGLSPGKYTVEFEKRYHTLKPSVSNRPANLDAFLYNADNSEAIAVEVKMTEWIFNKPGNLKAAYLDESSYINEEAGKVFSSVARSLIWSGDYEDPTDKKAEYPPFSTRYDAFQMFKHAVGCYTACVSEEKRPVKKITLLNILWKLPEIGKLSDETQEIYYEIDCEEQFEIRQFIKRMEPVKKLFADIGVDFSIKGTETDMAAYVFDFCDEEINYLERYLGKAHIEQIKEYKNFDSNSTDTDMNAKRSEEGCEISSPGYSKLYEMLQDIDIGELVWEEGQVIGYCIQDIYNDCIKLKESRGFAVTETLDMFIPDLAKTMFWANPEEELIKILKWICK